MCMYIGKVVYVCAQVCVKMGTCVHAFLVSFVCVLNQKVDIIVIILIFFLLNNVEFILKVQYL